VTVGSNPKVRSKKMSDRISELLDSGCVRLDLSARKKPALIHELVSLLVECGRIHNPESIESAVLERESLTSTGIGDGIAIPHCLTPHVDHTVMAFGRHGKGAKFDAVDRKPVRLFFLIVGPENAHNEHLRLLSKLSRHLHDQTLRTGLLSAKKPEEIVALFAEKES
jgi:fructose-specific phosphotransferase system IIA component